MTAIEISLNPSAYGEPNGPATLWRLKTNGWWEPVNGPVGKFESIERPLVIGTVGGRHSNMRADLYLLSGKVEPGQATYNLVYQKMTDLCTEYPGAKIHLIYSGLTEVTLAAVFGLLAMRQSFEILRYDRSISGYIPIDLTGFRKAMSPPPPEDPYFTLKTKED